MVSKKYLCSVIDVLKYKANIQPLNEINKYYDSLENKEEMKEIIKMQKAEFVNKNYQNIKFKIGKVKNREMFQSDNNKEFKL